MKIFILLLFTPLLAFAQFKLKTIEPKEMKEGQKIVFKVIFEDKKDSLNIEWGLSGNTNPLMNISSEGVFSWLPDFKTVARTETSKNFDFYIKASAQADSVALSDSVLVNITIKNTNKPPIIPQKEEIIWVSKANTEVQKSFAKEYYLDEEGDAIAFRILENPYPNVRLLPDGVLNISLTTKELKALPDTLFFEVFEQNTEEKLSSRQKIVLKRAELDEPPSIRLVPDSPKYKIEEGDEVNIEINISDENDDLKSIDFFTIPQTSYKVNDFLVKKTHSLYLFSWKPSLDFVKTEENSRSFQLVFTATDEAKQTTTKQIDFEVMNKIDWLLEDNEREKNYQQVVFNASEIYLRLEKTFQESEKEIKKLLKNKKIKNFASRSLHVLSQNANLVKNEDTKNKLLDYAKLSNDVVDFNDNAKAVEAEFPAEFSQLNRFTNIVTFLKDIFVDTEQFIEIYRNPINRRKAEFLTDKATLQKKTSSINKDNSLKLALLKTNQFDIKTIFRNF